MLARLLALDERLEDVRQNGGRDPGSMVADADRELGACRGIGLPPAILDVFPTHDAGPPMTLVAFA
jgi:hypothetical protein